MDLQRLTKAVLGSIWVIIVSIILVTSAFFFYGRITAGEHVVTTFWLVPSSSIPESDQYPGSELLISAGQFGGLVQSWVISPDFTKETFQRVGKVPSENDLVSSPLTLKPSPSPLSYQLLKSTASGQQGADSELVNAALAELRERIDTFNSQADAKLRFTLNDSGTTVIKKDNTAELLRLTAPLLGLFVGIFVVLARETYRRQS